MIYRQWYAQLDLFDTIRRYLAILDAWKIEPPSRNRLFVLDFYFVNPSLLHFTHMTAETRRVFSALQIERPDQSFVQYPSPPILYTKMGGIQAQAFHNLTGRGLLSIDNLQKDQCKLSGSGKQIASQLGTKLVLPNEEMILSFLVSEFAKLGPGKGGLRSVTGLTRMGI